MTLPGELERLLNDLGFTWPEVDEEELFNLGGAWCQFGSAVSQAHQSGGQAVSTLTSANQSSALEAFQQNLGQVNSPMSVMSDASTGVNIVGAACYVAGTIVLGVKIYTIINLVILAFEIAEAIATAAPTFGASLAEIPVFKELTQRVVDGIINEAINAILS